MFSQGNFIYERNRSFFILQKLQKAEKEKETLQKRIQELEKNSASLIGTIPELFEAFLKNSGKLLAQQESSLPVNDGDIEKLAHVGSGSFKQVYKAKWKGKDVALVQFHGNSGVEGLLNDKEIKSVNSEARKMQKLGNHPNIVQLLSVTTNHNLVLELCSGDLTSWMKQNPSLKDRFKMVYGFLAGVKFTHLNGMAHGDLKPQNILVSQDGVAKLSDFGSTRNVYTTCLRSSTKGKSGGTQGFLGPETAERDLRKKLEMDAFMKDIYAVGGVLLYFFSGKCPFESLSLMAGVDSELHLRDLLSDAWREKKPFYPEEEFDDLKKYFIGQGLPLIGEKMEGLIKSCMNTFPHERPRINILIARLREIEHDANKLSAQIQNLEKKEKEEVSDRKSKEDLSFAKHLELLPIILDLLVKKYGEFDDRFELLTKLMALNNT
jgi:serine/threonine protein kinase